MQQDWAQHTQVQRVRQERKAAEVTVMGQQQLGSEQLGSVRVAGDRARGPSAPGAVVAAPLPASVRALLARSDAELVAAQLAQEPGERFVHAHLAALRAGAALLEVTGRPRRRPAPRSVWDMVAAVAPELSGWTSFFAAGAGLRSAVEAGRDGLVGTVRAEQTVAAAEDFQDAVRTVLDRPVDGSAVPVDQRGRAAS